MAKKIHHHITVRKGDDSKEYYRQYNAMCRNKEVQRKGYLRRRYGITIEEYNELFEKQRGRCAICGTTEVGGGNEHFHVDHCHATGKIRGLLCNHCNQGLGHFKDNVVNLQAAIEYLK